MFSTQRLQSLAAPNTAAVPESGVTDPSTSQGTDVAAAATQSGPLYPSSCPASCGGSPWTMQANPIQANPTHTNPIQSGPPASSQQNDVALLDQAEALAQDAFRRVSPFNPNPTAADRFVAASEMLQAQIIRNQVRKDLNPGQAQQLDQINSEEQQAVTDASSVGGGFIGELRRDFAAVKMIDGANQSKALDNSLQGIPNSGPPFPRGFFGQIS